MLGLSVSGPRRSKDRLHFFQHRLAYTKGRSNLFTRNTWTYDGLGRTPTYDSFLAVLAMAEVAYIHRIPRMECGAIESTDGP